MLFHTECDLFGGGSKNKIWVNEEKWEIAVGPTMVQIWGEGSRLVRLYLDNLVAMHLASTMCHISRLVC